MFIYYEKIDVTKVIEEGVFNCPQCNIRSIYDVMQIQEYTGLFSKPIIAGKVVMRYVECRNCEFCFDEEILNIEDSSMDLTL